MPAGPPGSYEERTPYSGFHQRQHQPPPTTTNNNEVSDLNGDESAASILQSVKEQEAQFEQLTRELEAERQSVATQLERCKLGSETASMSSISSTDESFHWRQPAPQETSLHHVDEESDAESKMSGSQLVDSCLRSGSQHQYYQRYHPGVTGPSSRRVLQERGLMNVGEDPLEYLQDDPNAPPRPPPSSEHYTPGGYSQLSNGPTSGYDRTGSPNPSVHSTGSRSGHPQHHQVVNQQLLLQQQSPYGGGGHSPQPADPYAPPPIYSAAVGHPHHQPRSYSPAASSQGRSGTPTRFTPSSPYSAAPAAGSDPRYNGTGGSYQHLHPPANGGGPVGADPYQHSGTMLQYDPPYEQGAYRVVGGGDDDPYGDSSLQYQHSRDNSYDQYPGPGGDRAPPAAGPNPYHTGGGGHSPYASRPSYEDVGAMDLYHQHHRSTPPAGAPASDDTYRRLPNGSYSNMSATDRYRNTPPIDGGAADPYRDIPAMDDDRFDPNRPPSERGDAYMGRLEDDQYADARPTLDAADRYGRPLGDDGRQRQTPSPAPGSDRPGTFGYGDEHENPYGSRSAMPQQYSSGPEGRFDDPSNMGRSGPYDGPPGDSYGHRGPSPGFGHEYDNGDPQQPRSPLDRPSPRAYENLGPPNMYNPDEGMMPRNMYGEPEDDERRPYPNERGDFEDGGPHLQGAPDEYDPNRRSPSVDSETRDQRWRNPDLPEVIDFLSHSSNAIKANAAAYLQHLCYMDDGVKAKTRGLGGIPALVELVNNEIPEVHRAACGALRNLSFGRANDENKRGIKNAGGIPALIRLLRKSPDNDVRELVTGILWNLSSCQDIKKQIIDDGLAVIVNTVIIPHSGWDRNLDEEALRQPRDVYWSTVFRNASGILRNISSDAEYARKKLRECEGLVDSVFYIVRAAIGKNDIDNKSVENCVCVLRNLSYACQEVEDPSYLKRRNQPKPVPTKGETTGCFGGNKKKKDPQKIDQRGRSDSGYQSGRQYSPSRPRSEPVRGMELLWQPDVVSIYLPLLSDCSNPETLEAAAGAIQNLAACDWQPSADIRAAVRKERGLPIIVELLTVEADRVVCAAATALRNLALDHRNKELIGKYAMRQLVMKLPQENKQPDFPVSDDTVTAVQATLYEVVKKNADFAQSLLSEGGVERLIHITKSRGKYSNKVVKFASSILYTMWQFRELHPEYKNRGYKEQHFVTRTMAARGGPSTSANNTLNRPRMDLGGGHPPSSATHSEPSSPGSNQRYGNSIPPGSYASEPAHTPDSARYRDDRLRPEEIPMRQMGSATDMPSPGYASLESPRGQDDYRPAGGVPLFSNLPPGGQQPQPQVDSREPLYAQVNKPAKRRPEGGVMLDARQADGGADSWV